MTAVIFWTIIFSAASAFSITLLGDRSLISGNLLEAKNFLRLIFHWKFILSMTLAILARASFIMINNNLLKIPRLAPAATTITNFITLFSLIFVAIANFVFLKEKLNTIQISGALIILFGAWIMMK